MTYICILTIKTILPPSPKLRANPLPATVVIIPMQHDVSVHLNLNRVYMEHTLRATFSTNIR